MTIQPDVTPMYPSNVSSDRYALVGCVQLPMYPHERPEMHYNPQPLLGGRHRPDLPNAALLALQLHTR